MTLVHEQELEWTQFRRGVKWVTSSLKRFSFLDGVVGPVLDGVVVHRCVRGKEGTMSDSWRGTHQNGLVRAREEGNQSSELRATRNNWNIDARGGGYGAVVVGSF